MTNDNKPFEKAQRENPLTDEEILNEVYPIAHYDTDKEQHTEDSLAVWWLIWIKKTR